MPNTPPHTMKRSISTPAIAEQVVAMASTVARELIYETQFEAVTHTPSYVAGMCMLDKHGSVPFPSALLSMDMDQLQANEMATCFATPSDSVEVPEIISKNANRQSCERFANLLASRVRARRNRKIDYQPVTQE